VTVRCPSCGTRYRLPPRSRLGRNPTYRCTRCRHVFAPDEEAEAPALEEADDDEVLDDDDGPVFTIEPAAPARRDDDGPPPRRPAADGGTSAIRFAARAMVLVSLAYGVLSIYVYTHAARARALLGAIPLVGADMTETRLGTGSVQLADVHGDWKRVHGDALVFVVTGTAINNAPVPIAAVQVEGRIVGREEHQQVVYCGTAPQDVQDLSPHEIELLQTLKPSNDWILPPGGQDRFLIAFVDPPVPLNEFSAEVVSVRGATRRPDGASAGRAAP
jgi:predicted Zn finger-like uncharacterized protein